MARRDATPARAGRDGFIIVAVLWILIALATLASIYSVYIANTAMALAVTDDTLQAELLATTALELTAYRLSSPMKEDRPTRGRFGFRAGAANVAVSFVSEAARIDLNVASKEMLAGLFAALGVKEQAAVGYADRIIGWRTPPKPDSASDEDVLYRGAGVRYPPRGGPFAHPDELWLVYGLPPALIDRIRPFVTIYSGQAKVNVLDAAPEVIAALPGMTPALLNSFLDKRESGPVDPESLPKLLGASQAAAATMEGSDAVRVDVRIGFDNGRQVSSEAVILTGTSDEPYHVLYWRDDASNGPAQLRTGPGLR